MVPQQAASSASVGGSVDMDGFVAFLPLDNLTLLQLCFSEVMSEGRTVVSAVAL